VIKVRKRILFDLLEKLGRIETGVNGIMVTITTKTFGLKG
jgi:hypothetical protein